MSMYWTDESFCVFNPWEWKSKFEDKTARLKDFLHIDERIILTPKVYQKVIISKLDNERIHLKAKLQNFKSTVM